MWFDDLFLDDDPEFSMTLRKEKRKEERKQISGKGYEEEEDVGESRRRRRRRRCRNWKVATGERYIERAEATCWARSQGGPLRYNRTADDLIM